MIYLLNILGIRISKDGEDIKCERLVKYDGKKLEISGLSVGDFKLGKFGIEPTLLQTASHALMLLDASQYYYCSSIRNLKDKQRREEYVAKMIDDQRHAQTIYHALSLLSMDPSSAEMQDTVKKMLLSSIAPNRSRATEIEKSNLLEKIETSNTESENSLEIGNTSFQTKFEQLTQSYPQLKEEQDLNIRVPPRLDVDESATLKMTRICKMIYDLSQEYTISLRTRKFVITEFWDKLASVLQTLALDNEIRKFVGTTDADTLETLLISIGGEGNQI